MTDSSFRSLGANAYFLPASSYYHKNFYSPSEPPVPFRQTIAYFNRAHPRAAVLLTEDSFAAGLTGEVYENHWHQSSVMREIRRAPDIARLRSLLQQWNVQYFIARQPKPQLVRGRRPRLPLRTIRARLGKPDNTPARRRPECLRNCCGRRSCRS